MFCSLNSEEGKKAYIALTTYVGSVMNNIAFSPVDKFDIDKLMKDTYDNVYNSTNNYEQAIDITRMIPRIVLSLAPRDITILSTLIPKGLNLSSIAEYATQANEEQTGISFVEDTLGLSKDLIQEVKDAQEGTVKQEVPEEKIESELPEVQTPAEQLTFSFDENGEVETVDVTDEQPISEEAEEGIILPEDKIFEAVAPRVLKDTDQEAESMDKASSKFNVANPLKKLFYKVKRNIVRAIKGGAKSSEINYPGVGPLYLKAQSSSLLPENIRLSDTAPVVLVVVDKDGNAVKFDENGKVSSDGKISFYNLRTPFDIDGKYEKKRIDALAKQFKVDKETAKKVLLKERAVVEEVLEYISKDVNKNSVLMDITGGTLGHLGTQDESYPISKVAFGKDVFRVESNEKGEYFFRLPSVSDDTIRIERAEIKDTPQLVELLSDFIVNDIYTSTGSLVSNKDKRQILERYLMLNSSRVSMITAGPILLGEKLSTNTPEEKAAAKAALVNYFNSLFSYKVLDKSEVNDRVNKGAKIVSEVTDSTNRGDILASTDINTGELVYQLLSYPTLNITKAGLDAGIHFSLAADPVTGGMRINYIKNGYTENYIKESHKIDRLLNGENQLVALNAYLTFEPLAYETGKIDPVTTQEEEEEIDDFELAMREAKEEQRKAYEALPAETKEAMAVVEAARTSLPFKGILSQQAVLTFENNLKGGLYSREFAVQVLESLKNEIKLSAEQVRIAEANIRKYTKPVQAPISPAPVTGSTNITATIQPVVNKEGKVNIYDGTKENAHLSNFAERPFVYEGTEFPTVEHAFQYAKGKFYNEYAIDPSSDETPDQRRALVDKHLQKILNAKTAAEAKRLGRAQIGVDFEDDMWDDASPTIMKKLIEESFKQNPEALANLLTTGNLEFTHTQDKSRWGKEFPKLLMEVRNELRGTQPVGSNTVEIQDPLDQKADPDSKLDKKRKVSGRKANRTINLDNDDFGKRIDNDEEHFKMYAQKSVNPKATMAQIEAARKWYESNPLSKIFPFRSLFDLVNEKNPDSVATWSMNGIMLYKGSDFTDLYHEAWHGFTQGLMTPEQRNEIYAEVRKKTGSFVDFQGKIVQFENANNKQLEEYLAEDFRKYMLSKGKKVEKGTPKKNTFFRKLLNLLEFVFGNLTIQEVVADNRASSRLEEIYEKLSAGEFSDYAFNKDNAEFGSLNKSGVQALQEEDTFSGFSAKESKLLLDSMDAWIAEAIMAANAGIENRKDFADFTKKSIDMFMGKMTPEQMEEFKLEMAPKLTYGQTAKYLRTKEGRTRAYKAVQYKIGELVNSLAQQDLAEKDLAKKQKLRELHTFLYRAYVNFGDLTDIENNTPDKDGKLRGLIAYHMEKSKEFGGRMSELLDESEQSDETKSSKSEYTDKRGNDTSLRQLAKQEVIYLFKTLYKYDPKTGQPELNEIGAPILMDITATWNKVALILENERNPAKMYEKLLAYAQNPVQTEMTYAIRQLLTKMGPKGVNLEKFSHIMNRDSENLWTDFWTVFSTRRIPLIAMSTTIKMSKSGNVESTETAIGRGINPNIQIGKAWNSLFKSDTTNKYMTRIDGVPRLDIQKILDDFKDYNTIISENRVFDFLDALGIKLTRNQEIEAALQYGDPELGISGDYALVRTLMMPSLYRLKNDGEYKKYAKNVNETNAEKRSLLQILNDNGVWVQQPSDLFEERTGVFVASREKLGPETYRDLTIGKIEGEKRNWNNALALEGQYGQGVVSFMVTTASGTTQFEHSLNSTMSIMVTSLNEVQDDENSSAYEKLIKMPHMSHFDINRNPNARRYAWLRNMFNIDKEYEGTSLWGKRKEIKGVPVKLELYNISGAKEEGKEGVSSASADPFTKFILDLHLVTQKGLPELLRHSDKSTSYSVGLNYIMSPDGLGDPKQGMYLNNTDFLGARSSYHGRAFANYLLPNIISEHTRIMQMRAKKEEIDNILKQIIKEKKEGKQITPTPVYDFTYLKEGQKFQVFGNIFNKTTKDELLSVDNLEEYFNDLTNPKAQELMNKLVNETQDYFEKKYNEVKGLFDKGGFVSDNNIETFIKDLNLKDFEMPPNKSQVIDALLNSFTYNNWIHNLESINMLYGDLALYNHVKEEFHKRNAGIASTGKGYRTDADMIKFINEYGSRDFENQIRSDQGLPLRQYDGTMNTGVMRDKITRSEYLEDIGFNLYNQMKEKAMKNKPADKTEEDVEKEIKTKLFGKKFSDIEITSDESLKGIEPEKGSVMSNYASMNEADGQGWIGFDAYRILSMSQNVWSPAQENLYQAMLRGEEIDGDKIGTFFPPIKAQYWGTLKTNDMPVTAFHKFQLAPIIPSRDVPGTKMHKLHEKMMAEGVDYVLFESGSKVGTLTSAQFNEKGEVIRDEEGNVKSLKDDIYNKDREITDNPFTINTIYVEYLKNQLSIEAKYKGKVTIPTQIRKLIEVDMTENGVPTDYNPGGSLEDKIESWFGLSEKQKLEASNYYKKIKKYENSVFNLTLVKKQQLLNRAKLKINSDGELVGNMSNLIDFVKTQLTAQDIADHELDFIDFDYANNKMKNDLSFSLSADKIENLLNALVYKTMIRQTTKGESLIQVSGAMLEGPRLATEEETVQYGGTNGLTYYTINKEKGIINAMKIKISMQGDFEKLLYIPGVAIYRPKTDDEGNVLTRKGVPVEELDYNASLKNLNRLLKDEAWLDQGNNRKMISLHGDRIPIQGLNSDEFAEVYEFLPKDSGNIVILPAELVAKSGGDFDIDKITWMMPNIGMSSKYVDGKLEYNVDLYEEIPVAEMRKRYSAYKAAYAKKELTDNYKTRADKEKALTLHFELFGGQTAVYSSVISLALEEGDLLSFEDFVLADQEKVAQNELLFSINDLSSQASNYTNLIRPNGTDILDPIVDDLKKVYRDYRAQITTNDEDAPSKGIHATRALEYNYNLFKHMTNNYGKKVLGIGAVDNTYNELFNRVGMYLVPNNREFVRGLESGDLTDIVERALAFKRAQEVVTNRNKANEKPTPEEYTALNNAKKAYTKEDQDVIANFQRQTLYLPHNKMKVKDASGVAYKDKAISMSHIMDAKGENKIGDVISQMMNGWVDIAKDPWVFYIRGDEKLGPMLLFMVQAGAPVRHAAYLLSQPVIVEYMETISKLQSQFSDALYKNETDEAGAFEKITKDKAVLRAKEIMMEKLGYEITGKGQNRIRNLNQTISEESIYVLDKVLKDGEFAIEDLEDQLDHVKKKYNKFGKDGQLISTNTDVDYNDPKLADYQKSVFLHFLQIVNMENALKDVKLRTNFDTAKTSNLYEAQDKMLKLMELKRSRTDSKTQNKYWRLPSEVIDRMVPTIKDKSGRDTGILDESRVGAIIGGFYQQPFQLELWKDLFPLRNNPALNSFMVDMSFTMKDDAKNETYFKDDVELMSAFKSSLLPALFQNSFLGFDATQLNKSDLSDVKFRDLDIELEKVSAFDTGAMVKNAGSVVNGVKLTKSKLYVDVDALWRQFNQGFYATSGYSKLGLAKLNPGTFTSFNEYVKFAFEREYLRSQYVGEGSKRSMKALQETAEYKEYFKDAGVDVKRKTVDGVRESSYDWNKRRHRLAFERYIKDKALQNSYNMYAMFNGQTAYAFEITRLKFDPRFEGLVKKFPVLDNLVPDSEQSKVSGKERVNLAFLNAPTTADEINNYYEQLQDLANEIEINKAIPGLTRDEQQEITSVFKKLPIVAFLQSGMSTVGRYSLVRVVDQNTITSMLLDPVKEFTKKISQERAGDSYQTLNTYWNAFVAANKIYDARGKNYVIKTNQKGESTSDLRKAMFTVTNPEDRGVTRTYDPVFINDQGVPMPEYSRVGDTIDVKFTVGSSVTPTKGNITNISWDGKKIVATVQNQNNNKVYTFKFSPSGDMTDYIKDDGKPGSVGIVSTSFKITDDLVKQLTGTETPLYTQAGNQVTAKYIIDGKPVISTLEVLDIEDIGYSAESFPTGNEYTSNESNFIIKVKNPKNEKVSTYIVNAYGDVMYNVFDNGNIAPAKGATTLGVKLPLMRKRAGYIVRNFTELDDLIKNNGIMPGAVVDLMQPHPTVKTTKSELYVYDEVSLNMVPVTEVYDDVVAEVDNVEDEGNFFMVYNGAVSPRGNIYQERTSATAAPGGRGSVDLKDRFIHHAEYTNKVGLISRLMYGGGTTAEFITDAIDSETGAAIVRPEIKEAIDISIEEIKNKIEVEKLNPRFSSSGYGQYMIGADDMTGEIIGDPIAKETFIYLSKKLLELGYINPNFIEKAEGLKEVAKATQQPITDEEFMDLMNKCFNL